MDYLNKILGLIPARYNSSRLPGKPLLDIGGSSMIMRVYEKVSKVLNNVYVLTDDIRIYDHVIENGGKCLITKSDHMSGTSRCIEAIETLSNFDYVINIQGDEPFIKESQIKDIINNLNPDTEIITMIKSIDNNDDLYNKNNVKVVINKYDDAMYFSRSVIPYGNIDSSGIYYHHIGIYGYSISVLKDLGGLEESYLNKKESLEQLNWLYNCFKIKTIQTTEDSIGIDTEEDLLLARKIIKKEHL